MKKFTVVLSLTLLLVLSMAPFASADIRMPPPAHTTSIITPIILSE